MAPSLRPRRHPQHRTRLFPGAAGAPPGDPGTGRTPQEAADKVFSWTNRDAILQLAQP